LNKIGNKLSKKKFFITIEGCDGSGKTTHCLFLKKYIKQKCYDVMLTREPGGTICSEVIRKILLNPKFNLVPLTELFLYEAARAQHVKEVIIPSLNLNKIVICDRFLDTTIAYQGYGRKLDLKFIDKLNSIASYGIIPDLTIYFDIESSYGINIARKSNHKYKNFGDRMERESIEFYNNVRKGYLINAKKNSKRIKIVKVKKTIISTQKLIKKIIDMVL
jgi:dTMP kinase